MADFNYGISCEDSKKAQKLHKHIAGINIAQDGLDVFDERVTVISNNQLLAEIESYSKKNVGAIRVEVWSLGLEFDDAEASGKLEVFEFDGKSNSKGASAEGKLTKFKSYSGSKENIEAFKSWLNKADKIEVISEWQPEVEYGSYGIEYLSGDSKFDKSADKQWMSKGVITEKLKG